METRPPATTYVAHPLLTIKNGRDVALGSGYRGWKMPLPLTLCPGSDNQFTIDQRVVEGIVRLVRVIRIDDCQRG